MLRDFRRTRHFQLCLSSVCKAEALWKRWCFQSVLENSVMPMHCCKGLLWWNTWSDSCWRAMKTSSKSGWHHHKYRNLCGYVKCYLLFVPGRRFCEVHHREELEMCWGEAMSQHSLNIHCRESCLRKWVLGLFQGSSILQWPQAFTLLKFPTFTFEGTDGEHGKFLIFCPFKWNLRWFKTSPLFLIKTLDH